MYYTSMRQFITKQYLFLFCTRMTWFRPEDRAQISPTCFATHMESTPILLNEASDKFHMACLPWIILVLINPRTGRAFTLHGQWGVVTT